MAISNLSREHLLGHSITIDIASDTESARLAAEKERSPGGSGVGQWAPGLGWGNLAGDMACKVSEALAKMEQRCDLWLSRKIAEDQWHTFEDCLVAVRGRWGNAEEDWITMYRCLA